MKKLMIVTASFGLAMLSMGAMAAMDNTTMESTNMTVQTQAQQNLEQGEAFLAKNKTVEGVVTLPDGLQYKVITPGTGTKPTANDTVTVNYEGKLIDGKVFDSSYARGKPISFPVNGVIPGWQQALQLMKTGATWELYIPPSLAYGERGAPGAIGPNETLIFKVELLSING